MCLEQCAGHGLGTNSRTCSNSSEGGGVRRHERAGQKAIVLYWRTARHMGMDVAAMRETLSPLIERPLRAENSVCMLLLLSPATVHATKFRHCTDSNTCDTGCSHARRRRLSLQQFSHQALKGALGKTLIISPRQATEANHGRRQRPKDQGRQMEAPGVVEPSMRRHQLVGRKGVSIVQSSSQPTRCPHHPPRPHPSGMPYSARPSSTTSRCRPCGGSTVNRGSSACGAACGDTDGQSSSKPDSAGQCSDRLTYGRCRTAASYRAPGSRWSDQLPANTCIGAFSAGCSARRTRKQHSLARTTTWPATSACRPCGGCATSSAPHEPNAMVSGTRSRHGTDDGPNSGTGPSTGGAAAATSSGNGHDRKGHGADQACHWTSEPSPSRTATISCWPSTRPRYRCRRDCTAPTQERCMNKSSSLAETIVLRSFQDESAPCPDLVMHEQTVAARAPGQEHMPAEMRKAECDAKVWISCAACQSHLALVRSMHEGDGRAYGAYIGIYRTKRQWPKHRPAPTASRLARPCGYSGQRIGEAKQPGPDSQNMSTETWPRNLALHNSDGTQVDLCYTAIKTRGLWRWQAQGKTTMGSQDGSQRKRPHREPRRNSTDKHSASEALRDWAAKHARTLDLPSQEMLHDVLQAHAEGPRVRWAEPISETMPIHPTQLDSLSEADLTQEDHLSIQRPPEMQEATRIAHMDIHDIIRDRRCQRHLPKSSRDLCVQASLYLLELAEKHAEADMRQAALALLTIAPQLLWPEPRKVMVRDVLLMQEQGLLDSDARCYFVENGSVLSNCLMSRLSSRPQRLIMNDLTRIGLHMRLKKHDRQEMLAKPGVKPKDGVSSHQETLLWKKCGPNGPHGTNPCSPPRLWTQTYWKMSWMLKHWTRRFETWMAEHQRSRHCTNIIRLGKSEADGWLPSTCSHTCYCHGKCTGASKMVPLKKNMQGDCRPVAVPTAAHKVMAMLLMKALLPGGMPLFQDKQYGIKKRNGAAELARDVTRAMHAHPMHCVVQVDIANAFGSIQRGEVNRSIEQIGHPAGHLASKWLWSEHTAAVALPGRELRGSPKKTRFSALLFSLAYNGLVQRGLDHHALGRQAEQDDMSELVQSWAYIDDLTLMCDPKETGAVLAALEHSLADGGLLLNRRKASDLSSIGCTSSRSRRLEGVMEGEWK